MPAVSGLSVAANRATWTWTKPDRAGTYDVARGSLTALRAAAGNFAASSPSCVASDVTSPSTDDATEPVPDEALYWLVRVTECGGLEGTWADGHPSQVGTRDGGLAAACP